MLMQDRVAAFIARVQVLGCRIVPNLKMAGKNDSLNPNKLLLSMRYVNHWPDVSSLCPRTPT